MSGNIKVVTFELFTLERSGWTLHSRFPSDEEDEALAEARSLERTLDRATKLVRETYYPDDNQYKEAVVRISADLIKFKKRLKQSPQNHTPRQGQSGGGGYDPFAEFADKPVTPLNPRQVITGVTMMLASALVVAGALTGILAFLMRTHILSEHIRPHVRPQVLFIFFVAVFILSALPLISRYIPHFSSFRSKKSEFEDDGDIDPKSKLPTDFLYDVTEQEKESGAPALFKDDPGLLAKSPELPPEPAPEPKPEPVPQPVAEPVAVPKIEIIEEPKEEEVVEVDENGVTQVPDKQRMTMMRFLTGTITILKDTSTKLDPYNKFGLNLIMAGACSALGIKTGLSEKQISIVTKEAISMLGGKAALTNEFCKNLDAHIADQRHAAMFQQGQMALDAYLNQTGTPFEDISSAMQNWNKPSGRITGAKIITIMFTDIVSSTLITYRRGDELAQAYIHAHNAIVRDALWDFEGTEIKHTGDGIMASFITPTQAVDAAIVIQKAIQKHNTENPDLSFQLRIGLNTGEPIREDDDLFGSSVQLAARICGEAGPGHIYISSVVHELVGGQSYPMQRLKPRALKGVKETQVFHDVLWANVSDNDPSDNTSTVAQDDNAAPITTFAANQGNDTETTPELPPEDANTDKISPAETPNTAQQEARIPQSQKPTAEVIITKA